MSKFLSFLPVILFLVYWLACFGAMLLYLYKKCWPKPAPTISFYITDLWAAILGLTPSFLLIKYVVATGEPWDRAIPVSGIALIGQLFGACAGWLLAFDGAANWTFGGYDRTIWILLSEVIVAPALLAAVIGTWYFLDLLVPFREY